jgi:hypothetical protein
MWDASYAEKFEDIPLATPLESQPVYKQKYDRNSEGGWLYRANERAYRATCHCMFSLTVLGIIMAMVLISFFYLKCIPCLLVIALGCFCLCLCEPYLNIPLWICIFLLVLMGWRLTEKDFVVSWGGAAHRME